MFIQILILIGGFSLLIFGANTLVKGSSNLAKRLNIPEILIGLTIVSLGTTLPELVVSIVSATSNNSDIVLGNALGSNLCNLLFILGIIITLKPVKFEKLSITKNLPMLIILTILVLILGSSGGFILNRVDGCILLIIALLYMGIPVISFFKDNKKNIHDVKEEKRNKSFLLKQIIYIILGGIALKFGGDFAVNSAINIAEMLKISERVIGLTIVAIGTSLPELITSVVAIIKGNEDIAEGNIIGACIINLCLVLGVGAVISNIHMTNEYIIDLLILLFSTILIWIFGLKNKENKLTRINGIVLFLIYLIYTIKLFIA